MARASQMDERKSDHSGDDLPPANQGRVQHAEVTADSARGYRDNSRPTAAAIFAATMVSSAVRKNWARGEKTPLRRAAPNKPLFL